MKIKSLIITPLICTNLCQINFAQETWRPPQTNIDIDALCPPRPQTAAQFKAGSYPPAAKPYQEAAKAAYHYMTSLPAMTALVETGEPNQKYQHNAYVSKTHAAHISTMLDWAKFEPTQRETAMRLAKASAEYLLSELEPQTAPLAFWPPTYGRKPLKFDPKTDGPYKKPSMVGNEPEAAVKYREEVMLLYPAMVGSAFVRYWQETKDQRFLDAAIGIAETYLKTRRADGSWPLKMRLATGEPIGENALVPNCQLDLFNSLFNATKDPKWRKAEDECFAWLVAHPLTDWNWDGQFEDIEPKKRYKNPTKHNAVSTMIYILKRFPGDKMWLSTCRKIMEFCEKRFVVWEAPASDPKWPAPSVLEQYSCFTPIDASAAKMIRGYLALYKAAGCEEDLAKARALANTITRMQKPSGRIPTFWYGVLTGDSGLSKERYDWLNCMGASAKALIMMADATRDSSTKAIELKNGAEFTLANTPSELTAQVKQGGMVRFLLEENGTTGYQWEATYASNECSVVIEHRSADTRICGASGKAAFTITKNATVQSPSLVEFAYRRNWEKNEQTKRVRLVLYTIPGEVADFRYPASRTLDMLRAECKNRGIEIIDWHVHIRGGLTPEMVAERERACGFRQSAMENHGREWEIFDNARLVAFADKARKVKINGHPLPVGIQVNDRDWFKQIDAATRAKFDYILADTMIMGKLPNGRDKRLWLIKDISEIGNPEKWMEEYVAMNLQILSEPISILANPGYLPTPLNGMHDKLWTEERMRKVISKAVERGIAIEIQAESPYPSVRFLKLAKSMGAKFSFGTNNYDAAPKNLSRWLEAIVWLDLKADDIWTPACHKPTNQSK